VATIWEYAQDIFLAVLSQANGASARVQHSSQI